MKKFLSLVLALVMTMSLVTVSAGAKEFTDDDKITYAEAVAVISEIGVVDGYKDGSFNPTNVLTRQAAAKIICNLILGPTTAAELHADTAPYKDVPVNSDFAGYIAYCQKEGIISGYADGSFRPGNTLTGYAFMKMLLGALGYDAAAEQYTGANWSINVAKRALNIGLAKSLEGEFNGIKAVTREEACLYAFNTLKADLVEYETSLGVNASGNLTSLSQAKAQTWNNSATRKTNIKDDEYIQFAEQYFPKLVRDVDGIDDFGRPSNVWSYNKKDIGTYVNRDLLSASYTKKVEGGEVWSDIGSAAAKFDLTFYVDGDELSAADTKKEASHLVKKNEDPVGASLTDNAIGNGVLTEVYVDVDKEETTIVQVHTWLAQVSSDYNDKNESLTLEIFNGATNNQATPETLSITKRIYVEDVPGIEKYEEDDMVLVTIASGEVMTVEDAESVSEVSISSYSTDYKDNANKQENKLTKLTADGNKYETSATAYEDAKYLWDYAVTQLKDNTYDLYLDPYGYVIGLRVVNEEKNYMFVAGYEASSSYLASAIDQALVIFTDGTMETVKVKDNKLSTEGQTALDLDDEGGNANVNKWYTYTEDNGVYTLKALVENQLADSTTKEISKTSTTVEETKAGNKTIAYGNANSTYISAEVDDTVVKNGGSIVKVENVSTGIKSTSIKIENTEYTNYADDDAMIFAMYNDNGYVTYAVVVGKAAGVSENLIYLTSGIKAKSLVDGEYVYTYEGITAKGDDIVTVESYVAWEGVKEDGNAKLAAGNLYEASFDKDGIITKMTKKPVSTNMNTAEYKTDGYAFITVRDNVYNTGTGALETDNSKELTVKGSTLWIDQEATNANYVLLDEDCKIFVKSSDESKYRLYTNIRSALNALGTNTLFTGDIVGLCDDAGIATTLILKDTNKENDETATPTPGPVASNLDTIAYEGGKLKVTLTAAATKDTTYSVTVSAMQSGAMYEIGTFKIDVAKGQTSGEYAIALVAGDYRASCGEKIAFFTVPTV